MFNLESKWIYQPEEEIQKISGVEYGLWKPTKRWIEMTTKIDCECPHFLFTFVEEIYRELLTTEKGVDYVESLKQTIKRFDVAFYPEPLSEMDTLLQFLGSGDLRGRAQVSAVNKVFWYFIIENYCKSKKSGSLENPMKTFAPKTFRYMSGTSHEEHHGTDSIPNNSE